MVYAMSMIRRWLRALIGWDEVEEHDSAQDDTLAVLASEALEQKNLIKSAFDRIEGHESRISRLQRQRDTAPPRISELDWEAQQTAFLCNPENFKEQN